jgi:hypothetical protein
MMASLLGAENRMSAPSEFWTKFDDDKYSLIRKILKIHLAKNVLLKIFRRQQPGANEEKANPFINAFFLRFFYFSPSASGLGHCPKGQCPLGHSTRVISGRCPNAQNCASFFGSRE